MFWSKNILVKKIFGQKFSFGQKIFGKKFLGKNNFGQKDLDPKFSLSKSNQVGLTQGGGYMTPPPENIRVKIVWNLCQLS